METVEKNSAIGYGKPPWLFVDGRSVSIKRSVFYFFSALYQLHLVKAETARAFIPKEFKLVEAFGYTLGGFFLANYEDSPAGNFDELVVIAGIVWNPPTSCAWAARVLVNSDQACVHGRKDVGLPSQVANFTKSLTELPGTKRGGFSRFLNKIGMANSPDKEKNCMDIRVEEMNNHISLDLCSINLTAAVGAQSIILTSSSTLARSNAGLLIINSQLMISTFFATVRLRAVPPAKVSGPSASSTNPETTSERGSPETGFATGDSREDKRNLTISVMLSKPILALEFNCLKMKVEAPTVVPP
ncbi:UNVERIFIED_CONTAM: protein NEOXANTHIN-DEFICIENT 1 [Sesamum radiatum]|uniref:Protein NEOXANTHIN-DEFICIENT 1 n=1 Tax=Sesamum radiatum TaxID=300843 RepID=A0AAW2N0N7_SESRA